MSCLGDFGFSCRFSGVINEGYNPGVVWLDFRLQPLIKWVRNGQKIVSLDIDTHFFLKYFFIFIGVSVEDEVILCNFDFLHTVNGVENSLIHDVGPKNFPCL